MVLCAGAVNQPVKNIYKNVKLTLNSKVLRESKTYEPSKKK